MGRALYDEGQKPEALDVFRQGCRLVEDVARADVSPDDPLNTFVNHSYWTGKLEAESGRPAAAIEAYRRAADAYERLARREPAAAKCRWGMGTCHHNVGNLQRDLGQRDEAIRSYRLALQIREQVCHAHPDNARYASELEGTKRRLESALGEADGSR
jgi:tetratricopeptide (TPR) repeat protein